MTRLIDADALLAKINNAEPINLGWITDQITNAPTVQREAINEVYEFEKWLNENTLIRANLNIELDYADPLAEIAYKAWQARSKLNLQTVQREGWVSVPIEEMVNRFLGWKLPSDFAPDCGIEFDANKYPNHKFEPIGTNLFTATQAKAMIEYMIQAAPTDKE